MTKVIGRYPVEISIGNIPADLKTLTTPAGFATFQADPDTLILTKNDQLEPAQVTIRTVFQPNNTQVSEQPINETITGLEAMATISIARDTRQLLEYAFNGDYIAGALTEDPGIHRFSDKGGLTVGACADLPFRTVVLRPFGCGDETLEDQETWFVFPWSFFKADATPQFGLGTQYSYNVMFTAFPNPATGKDRVLRGDTSLLPLAEYPNP